MTTVALLAHFPPCLCRLLARKPYGPPLTMDEIIMQAGDRKRPQTGDLAALVRHIYESLAMQTDWLRVPMQEGFYFLRGCGLDIDDKQAWRRVKDYLAKNPTFRYLHASPQWESYYKPLMIQWRKSVGPITPTTTEIRRNIPLWPPMRSLLIRLNPLLK